MIQMNDSGQPTGTRRKITLSTSKMSLGSTPGDRAPPRSHIPIFSESGDAIWTAMDRVRAVAR